MVSRLGGSLKRRRPLTFLLLLFLCIGMAASCNNMAQDSEEDHQQEELHGIPYDQLDPIETLDYLVKLKGKTVVEKNFSAGWINEKHVQKLLLKFDDKTACALPIPSTSSIVFPAEATVGRIAVSMVAGFATHDFPTMTPNWSREEADNWWKQYSQHKDEPRLNNMSIATQTTYERTGTGYRIYYPDRLRFPAHQLKKIKQQLGNGDYDIPSLVKRLDRPEECIVAHLLLNELLPAHRLELFERQIHMKIAGDASIPVKTGTTADSYGVVMDLKGFGDFTKRHWLKVLKENPEINGAGIK